MKSFLQKHILKTAAALLFTVPTLVAGNQASAQTAVFQGSTTGNGDGTSASAPKPADTEAEDLLVATISIEKGGSATITPPNADWKLIRRVNNSTNFGMAVYYKIATVTDAGPSVTNYSFGLGTSGKWAIGISRLTGYGMVEDSNPANQHPFDMVANIDGTTAPAINFGANTNNRLILCVFSNKKNSQSLTAGSVATHRYTAHFNTGASSMVATFTHSSGTTTSTVAATSSNTEFPIAMQISILPKIVNPLPVELVSFTAIKKSAEVILGWETASEKNNSGFEVQASSDGKNYEAIAFVSSQNGHASSAQRYAYTHKTGNKEGLLYYRLKQVDLDGSFEYYNAKVVDLGRFTATVNVYPNPFLQQFELNLNTTATETAQIIVSDMTGKTVYQAAQKLQKGANSLNVELRDQPAGLYLLKVTTSNQTYINRLVKQ